MFKSIIEYLKALFPHTAGNYRIAPAGMLRVVEEAPMDDEEYLGGDTFDFMEAVAMANGWVAKWPKANTASVYDDKGKVVYTSGMM